MSKFDPEFVGVYPFVTKNFNGEPVVVKSHKHRRQLMKQHNVHDDTVSPQLQGQNRRNYLEGEKEKRQTFLKENFLKAYHGKIDLRPKLMEMKKREYEIRNGHKKP